MVRMSHLEIMYQLFLKRWPFMKWAGYNLLLNFWVSTPCVYHHKVFCFMLQFSRSCHVVQDIYMPLPLYSPTISDNVVKTCTFPALTAGDQWQRLFHGYQLVGLDKFSPLEAMDFPAYVARSLFTWKANFLIPCHYILIQPCCVLLVWVYVAIHFSSLFD